MLWLFRHAMWLQLKKNSQMSTPCVIIIYYSADTFLHSPQYFFCTSGNCRKDYIELTKTSLFPLHNKSRSKVILVLLNKSMSEAFSPHRIQNMKNCLIILWKMMGIVVTLIELGTPAWVTRRPVYHQRMTGWWRRLAGHTWESCNPWRRRPPLRGQTASRCNPLEETSAGGVQ